MKEQHNHAKKRVSDLTFMSSSAKAPVPELLFNFKGKGKKRNASSPTSVNCQWSDSGLYRLENMLTTVGNLPTKVGPMERVICSAVKRRVSNHDT